MVPRYSRPEMTAIWSAENRYRIWWQIEVFAAEAMGKIGMIPVEDAADEAQGVVERSLLKAKSAQLVKGARMIGILREHGLVERFRRRGATLLLERHRLLERPCGRARVHGVSRELPSSQARFPCTINAPSAFRGCRLYYPTPEPGSPREP